MSASTRTIQRPMGQGSIFGAVALGAATLLAVVGIAWGALNLTATKSVSTPVAAPTYLDRGGRDLPKAAPAPYSPGKAGNVTPRFGAPGSIVGKPGNVTPRFDTGTTGSSALGGYFNAVAGGGHAAPLIDRNAENVVIQRGQGKHAE